jgi:chaperonin cofactor prefoldin
MDIKEAKADLKKRQEALAKRFNEILTQEESLAREKKQIIEEIKLNNGEARLLNRLNGDKPDK